MDEADEMQSNTSGRPAIGEAVPVQVRLQPDQLAALDAWIAQQEPQPSRPEAIQTLLDEALPKANTTTIRGEFG
jgi:hypothetical protein